MHAPGLYAGERATRITEQGLDFQSAYLLALLPRQVDLHDQLSGPNAESAHHNQPAARAVTQGSVRRLAQTDGVVSVEPQWPLVCCWPWLGGESAWAKAATLTLALPEPAQYNNFSRRFHQTSRAR